MAEGERTAAGGAQSRLLRGVRRAVRVDASAYGYSILITAVFGLANVHGGPATTERLFAYVVGASLGFALWEAIASKGFRLRIRQEQSDVVLVGTALAPLSVAVSLTAAFGVTQVTAGAWTWSVPPFVATVVYVTLTGAQLAAARIYEERHPPDDSE